MINTKAAAGLAVIALSTAFIFGLASIESGLPVLLGALGSLGMAAGALLVGTSEKAAV